MDGELLDGEKKREKHKTGFSQTKLPTRTLVWVVQSNQDTRVYTIETVSCGMNIHEEESWKVEKEKEEGKNRKQNEQQKSDETKFETNHHPVQQVPNHARIYNI